MEKKFLIVLILTIILFLSFIIINDQVIKKGLLLAGTVTIIITSILFIYRLISETLEELKNGS